MRMTGTAFGELMNAGDPGGGFGRFVAFGATGLADVLHEERVVLAEPRQEHLNSTQAGVNQAGIQFVRHFMPWTRLAPTLDHQMKRIVHQQSAMPFHGAGNLEMLLT
jgi:flavoprotein